MLGSVSVSGVTLHELLRENNVLTARQCIIYFYAHF